MKRIMCLLIVMVMVGGCATIQRMDRLRLGMSKEEVIKILGKPSTTKTESTKETLGYELSPTWDSFWSEKEAYCVVLENGKVTKYCRISDLTQTPP